MAICLDIGGSAIKLARTMGQDAPLDYLGRHATPLTDFDAFAHLLDRLCRNASTDRSETVSISITGVIDPDTGIITCANIPCIDGLALADALTGRLDRPVLVTNDADCFALAEATRGAGTGKRIVFGAILGTGIGGGLVINGKLVAGAGGISGEWGHAPVAATDTSHGTIPRFACGCGLSGCVDTIGGARGLERLYAHLHGQNLDSQAITSAWQDGEPRAQMVMDMHLELIAPPLAMAINLLGADMVPVGGGLASVPGLIARLDSAVRKLILRRTATPVVVPSHLGNDAGLIGAAIVAQQDDMTR